MKMLAVILAAILVVLLAVCLIIPLPENSLPGDIGKESTEYLGTDLTGIPAHSEDAASEMIATELTPVLQDEDFVRVADYISNVRSELAYSTANNFTGQQIYDFTDAYLRYGTAKKLAAASDELAKLGLGVVIWDGYRPIYAQEKLWQICPDPTFVSQPGTGSQSHCRGIAVDVTIYDLQSWDLLEMPTGFDNFTAKADRDYSDCTAEAAENALLLEDIMKRCGFKPYSAEWWHFSDTDDYPVEYEFDPANVT